MKSDSTQYRLANECMDIDSSTIRIRQQPEEFG